MTTKTLGKKMTVKSLAKSGWIDDLSEEEEKVLIKTHALDEKLRSSKNPIKIGILKE